MADQLQVSGLHHPLWRQNIQDWKKWRLTYEGGRQFINSYLEQYTREDSSEFSTRKKLTYCPRFAGAAIDDVKNAIYQRMVDISRVDGDSTYQKAVNGLNGGVDLNGSTMNRFLGQNVLPELLVMSKVGIYVDMPAEIGETLLDSQGKRPYLYYYTAEEIQSWSGVYEDNRMNFTSLLLKDINEVYDPMTNLATGTETQWRFYKLLPNGVEVQFIKSAPQTTGSYSKTKSVPTDKVIKTVFLEGMKRIPFVILELNKSLIEDIADYQIALMNLESSDTDYMRRSNFPFYVEQYDPRFDINFGRPPGDEVNDDQALKRQEKVIGAGSGRRYPAGANAPSFIHPSSEPLMASMQKEQQIKNDIRKLLNLSLSNLEPKFASADSKGMDDRSLESGLSSLGLILEHGERQVADIWSAYRNAVSATIIYPRSYSLKSEAERRDEAKSDSELLAIVPSITYQKKIAMKIAKTMVGHLVSTDELDKINKEITDAKYISSDALSITQDLTNGLVSDATASLARGYDKTEVAQAKLDHAERIARIQKAQAPADSSLNNPGARGVQDLNTQKGNTSPDNTNRPSSIGGGEAGGGSSGATGQ